MAKLNLKMLTTTVVLSTLSFASFSSKASEVSFEQALANLVISQGKAVMHELTEQLEQGIKTDISQFSIEQTIEFLKASSEQLANKETENTEKSSEE